MTRRNAFLRLPALVIVICMAAITAAYGSSIAFRRLELDFTNPTDAASKAQWSEPQKIAVTENGLGWDGEAASSREGWIRTKPLAVGYSWRPASHVSVRVSLYPAPKELVLNDGQMYTPHFGSVFVRYSPDLQHWSSWQTLQTAQPTDRDNPQTPGLHYQLSISVPQQERAAYGKLLSDYAQLDVPWKSDEDAAVRWIMQRDPGFFARQIPFIGYIEFLVETSFYGGQRIRTFSADIICSIGGRHHAPKDENNPKYKTMGIDPWKYVAAEKQDAANETSAPTH